MGFSISFFKRSRSIVGLSLGYSDSPSESEPIVQ